MKVVEYLKEKGVEELSKEFAIIIKKYDEGLLVLNYDQIESPKTHPIVLECRGLILDNDFNIVSRSFDRFFNLGENSASFNPETDYLFDKHDGSLIKIYNWKDVWYISTRGTAFAESQVNGWDLTFKEMVLKALGVDDTEFQVLCNLYLDESKTYNCEVTGVENRVVTRYNGYTLWLLAVRDNQTGEYEEIDTKNSVSFGFELPNIYQFSSIEECLSVVQKLPDLKEGYVAYNLQGVPVCKIKSPAYVACHHIRGEGLNPKRIAQLVVINEQSEYLTYFPEDEAHFTPYVEKLEESLKLAQLTYENCRDVESQKEFAIIVKNYPFAFLLFKARKENNEDIRSVFNSLELDLKVKFLLGLMSKEEIS